MIVMMTVTIMTILMTMMIRKRAHFDADIGLMTMMLVMLVMLAMVLMILMKVMILMILMVSAMTLMMLIEVMTLAGAPQVALLIKIH